MALRVAVIGGGPGGLFLASQLMAAGQGAEVTVLERHQPDDAFGFGVVFSDATLGAIFEADPVVRQALADHGHHWDPVEVWLKGERRSFAGNGMAAVHRKKLLSVLHERARAAGVDLRFGEDVDAERFARLRDEYDVVVGADGANSLVRGLLGEETLGHHVAEADAKFIWFGTRHLFDGLTFVHQQSAHGTFAAHAYPISEDVSTFIVETDEASWRAAGLDEFDVTQPAGPSDEKTRRYLTDLFEADLAGAEILANNSRWTSFRTRSTERWYDGNVVLLGDAVHTAHFSVGSGTKMAMEDGIALARALTAGHPDLTTAFAAYQDERQPDVARIQSAARGGLGWWERFGEYYDAFEPTRFGFHFFSRSINIDRIERRDPVLVKEVRDSWVAEHGSPALETPLVLGATTTSGRLLGWDGTDLYDGAVRLPGAAAEIVVVDGPDGYDKVFRSEALRLRTGTATVVVLREGDRLDAETLVLSGRADAVAEVR
ncbi:FAD-dependent monooxygenase [Pimelobacter simplex]|uniref:FAD-dependent monooxygenase n=1 Tax=Nocardioides simplex TaxID=2045 RepID=UPI003AABA46A